MRVLLLLVLALASSLTAWAQEAQKPRAVQSRFTSSTAYLELNGVPVGALKSFGGGNAVADVVAERGGKRLGAVRYEPIVLEVGAAMAPEFWSTLQQWPNLKPINGAVLIADFNYNIVKRLEFNRASISEISFPALDAAGKEAFAIQVTLTCDTIRTAKGGGKAPTTTAGKSKAMTTGNFRLSVDGLDTNRVSKIESFVLKQKVADGGSVDIRRQELELKKKAESGRVQGRPGAEFGMGVTVPECGDLVFVASEIGSDSLQSWFENSVIQGKNEEKNGKIELFTADLKTVLFSISLKGLGIYRLAPSAIEAGKEASRTLEARLYVEGASIEVGK